MVELTCLASECYLACWGLWLVYFSLHMILLLSRSIPPSLISSTFPFDPRFLWTFNHREMRITEFLRFLLKLANTRPSHHFRPTHPLDVLRAELPYGALKADCLSRGRDVSARKVGCKCFSMYLENESIEWGVHLFYHFELISYVTNIKIRSPLPFGMYHNYQFQVTTTDHSPNQGDGREHDQRNRHVDLHLKWLGTDHIW